MERDRRTRKRDRTRQALLNSALALFAEKGIYEPSIEEITSRADLGKGTFYQYFPSREALIAELVSVGFSLLLARVETSAAAVPRGEERLPAVLEAHQEFFGECPEYLLLFHQARGWMKLARHHGDELRQAFCSYVRELGALLGEPSPEGAPLPPRAVAVAGFIAGVLSFEKVLGVAPGHGLWGSLDLLVSPPPRRATVARGKAGLP